MQTFVLVHGAFHGGWCWSGCAAELTAAGARVFAPSLTGLGDRRHLFSPTVSLRTHVEDIVNLIEFEALDGCVLVGHSYAGNVLSGVADHLRDRIGQTIFVDATVPPAGVARWRWADANPRHFDARMAAINGPGLGMGLPPFDPSAFAVTDPAQVEWLRERLTPMPRDTYTGYIDFTRGASEGLKRSYIAAADPPYDNMKSTIERIRQQPDWQFRTLDTGHDMMVTKPRELAALLLELAAS